MSLHELNMSVIKKCYGSDCERVINGVDMIGFRSMPIKKRFEEEFGANRRSIVCWSGTPQKYLETLSENGKVFKDGNLTKFIYVGQTIKRKYPKETIEGIYNACGDTNYHLTYVGSKDLAYNEIMKFIDSHNLIDKVSFVGQIPRDSIIKYYDENECFILISKDEVFGLVYLEAMSRGCIVIASKDEGMEGIIRDNYNGFLCAAGNANELATIIKHINMLSSEQKKRISDNAIATARDLSDYNVAKRYINAVINL